MLWIIRIGGGDADTDNKESRNMTQTQQILNHLQEQGSITPLEAMQEYGCMRLGARIYDLKAAGWPITSIIERSVNRFGKETKYAKYFMSEKRCS